MSSIGSLFVAGKSAGSVWAEIQECNGVQICGVSTRATVLTSASNHGISAFSLTGRSPLASHPALQHAARTVMFERIAEGRDFMLGLTKYGKVYYFGKGSSGIPGVHETGNEPQCIPSLENIVAIASGDGHCVAVKDDGSCYTWGIDDTGQLGLGLPSHALISSTENASNGGSIKNDPSTTNENKNNDLTNPSFNKFAVRYQGIPKFVTALYKHRITAVACGSRHTLFITDQGLLFSTGEGLCGQLGLGNRGPFSTRADLPQQVFIEDLVASPPGDNLINTARSMEVIGGEDEKPVVSSRNNTIDTRVVAACAGMSHSVVLTVSGHVYTFGLNSYGELGLGDTRPRFRPSLVYTLSRENEEGDGLSNLGIGTDDDKEGDVFAYTQRGHSAVPLLASQIAAGPYHTAFLGLDGIVYTCGSSNDGRLGQGYLAEPAGSTVNHAVVIPHGHPQETTEEIFQRTATAIENHSNSQTTLSKVPFHYQWRFPNGVGPLAPPPEGTIPPPYQEPPHYVRNLQKEPVAPVETRDIMSGRPIYDLVKEGTWTLPVQRTKAHQQMLMDGKEFSLELASGESKAPYRARINDEHDITAHASTAVFAVNPRNAPKIYGKPWLRKARSRNPSQPITLPTPVRHPILDKRQILSIACAESETIVFSPSILQRIFPHSCADYGGTKVSLSGPGISSVCKVPEANLHMALSSALSQEAADLAVQTYFPRKDDTGMYAIAGVYVRWTCNFDNLVAGASRDVRKPLQSSEIHYSRAYYAVGTDFSGFEGTVKRTYPFKVRSDGTLYHATNDILQLDLDSLQTIAPSVSRPCSATVEIIVIDALEGENALPNVGTDSIVQGALRFDFYTQPTLLSSAPSSLTVSPGSGVNPQVKLVGEHLFGCALVDSQARIIAENLVQAVYKEVTQREAEEAVKLAAELETLDKTTKKKSSKAMAALKVTAVQNTRKQLQLFHHSAMVGTAEEPCDVLVTFDVMMDGVKHGRTDAVRGCYALSYDEHIIDVRSATTAIAAVTTGRLPTGTSAPVSTPSFGQKANENTTGSIGNSSNIAQPPDNDESEGIVGTYSATIVCTLPDLSEIIEGTALPVLPGDISSIMESLYNGESITDEAIVQRIHEFSYEALLSPNSSTETTTNKQPKISLYPRFSPNGGVDWIDPPPNVEILCLKPEASHISPAAMYVSNASSSINIKGIGFLPGTPAQALFQRLNSDGTVGTETVHCAAQITDSSTVTVTLPADIQTLFPSPATDQSSSSSSNGINGYCTLTCTLTIDSLPVSTPRPLLITLYTGTFQPVNTIFISEGSILSAALQAPTISCYDGISHRSLTLPTDISHTSSWIPVTATVGSVYSGIRYQQNMDISMKLQDSAGTSIIIPAVYSSETGSIAVHLPISENPDQPTSLASGIVQAGILFGKGTDSFIPLDGNIIYYSPHSLTITAVNGPKKFIPGSELQIMVQDLPTILGSIESSHYPLTEGSIVVRLTLNDVQETVPGHLSPDHTSINFILSSNEALLGDANVDVSLSGGVPPASAFCAPFLIKTVKK